LAGIFSTRDRRILVISSVAVWILLLVPGALARFGAELEQLLDLAARLFEFAVSSVSGR